MWKIILKIPFKMISLNSYVYTFTRQTFKYLSDYWSLSGGIFQKALTTSRKGSAECLGHMCCFWFQQKHIEAYQQEETLKVRPLLNSITSLFRCRYVAGVFCCEKCLMIISATVFQGLDLDKCDLLLADCSFSERSHLITFFKYIKKK